VKQGFPNHAIVSSAKGAVEGLTLALAAEFAPNVRVNCIAPSLTKSKISEFILKNEKMAESIAKMHPLKRVGEGSDSSSVAKFLLSEESSWITGQILGVDGGRSTVA
jgi:NAD(P)-dependent dehydrogenase (short-subunit alcohol dehydrogenase family)